jgi:hypothetical protein
VETICFFWRTTGKKKEEEEEEEEEEEDEEEEVTRITRLLTLNGNITYQTQYYELECDCIG